MTDMTNHDFSVETVPDDNSTNNPFGIYMPSGIQHIKKNDQIIRSFEYYDEPHHKFFMKGDALFLFISSEGVAGNILINLTSNILYSNFDEQIKGDIWKDVLASPSGDFLMVVTRFNEVDFYDFRDPESQRNLDDPDRTFFWKWIGCKDEEYLNDEYLLEINGNEEFSWIDDRKFVFHKIGCFRVVLEMGNNGEFTIIEREKWKD
jgi:hypothetical protein